MQNYSQLGNSGIISGGTENHLFLMDVNQTYSITGKEAEALLDKVNITINKNSIPFDTLSPMVTSGLRFGTAAMTSRGFTKWTELGEIIHHCLSNYAKLSSDTPEAKAELAEIKSKVLALTKEFPIKKSYL